MIPKIRYKLILAAIFLALASLACTQLDSLLPKSRDTTAGSVRVSDDFSSEKSGWEIGSYDGGDVGYFEGKYRITSIGDSITMWGAAGRSLEDMVIDVDTEQISAPENNNNDYGIICRLQNDGGGYYSLVSGDGFYSILRQNGEEGFDILVDWTYSSIINQGNSRNHLQLTCIGTKISLSVNGQLLAETSDTKFSSGDIGFTATSYEVEGTEVHFDNFAVK